MRTIKEDRKQNITEFSPTKSSVYVYTYIQNIWRVVLKKHISCTDTFRLPRQTFIPGNIICPHQTVDWAIKKFESFVARTLTGICPIARITDNAGLGFTARSSSRKIWCPALSYQCTSNSDHFEHSCHRIWIGISNIQRWQHWFFYIH